MKSRVFTKRMFSLELSEEELSIIANVKMENDDFYYDEEREEYMEIWICPQCEYREDIPE